jgi:transposase-like protein
MSKRYTPEEKAAALAALDENDGSILLTSLKTGVPERTLHSWKRDRLPKEELLQRRQAIKNTPPQPPPPQQTFRYPNDPELEKLLREQAAAADTIIDDVLDQLLKDVQVLSRRIRHNFDQAPPVSQIMALTRLLDRVIKLDARKPRLEPERRLELIRYQYPDGSIHKVPPWYPGDEDDADQPGFIPSIFKRKVQAQADDD